MKIYTKTGDKGETSLFGGKKVWKDDLRIEAYGSIDELNSVIGMAIAEIKNDELEKELRKIQNELFVVGSDLATPLDSDSSKIVVPRVDESFTKRLEKLIDKFDTELPQLKQFILPGGLKGAAILHNARTVCRRAERNVVALSKKETIGTEIEKYLNRLSDLLFVFARYENFSNGTKDIFWQK